MMKKAAAILFFVAALFCGPGSAWAQFVPLYTVTSVGNSGNAYTGTLANFTSWVSLENVLIQITPNANNSGDSSLQLNGNSDIIPFRKLTNGGLAPLTINDFIAGQPILAFFDGNNLDIVNTGTGGAAAGLPGGYLTPCQLSTTPISGCTAGLLLPTGDIAGAGDLFYEPAFGNTIPIYNGTAFINFQFTELGLALPSSRLANTLYDAFVFSNAGVPTLCVGPAWTTSTPGSGARGAGAGTTQIAQLNGIWVNNVAISCVNGGSTFSIPGANGTYVATCLMTASPGQVAFYRSWGQSRIWSCWNAYHQQNITLQAGDSTGTWSYTSATVRPSNNNAANSLTLVFGLTLDEITPSFTDKATISVAPSAGGGCNFGIGFNSTTAFSGLQGSVQLSFPTAGSAGSAVISNAGTATGEVVILPFGAEVITALEQAIVGNGCIVSGGQQNMILKADWRG